MKKSSQASMFRRVVMAVSATFAMTTLAGPVQADHVEEGIGILLGGIVGGKIGSAIGKGNGRRIAIGVGSALGALYGREVAAHHRPSTKARYHHPGRSQKARYHHPRRSHAPAVVKYYPQPVPVYVQPPPVPVYVTPPRTGEVSITVSRTGGGSTIARHKPASITECRLLEDGLAPVYGCRDAHGEWRILR